MFHLLVLSTLLPSVVSVIASPYSEYAATTNSTIGKPVNTTSGSITGHADQLYPAVSEYLGIPFAQPPINGLRFSPPQPFNGTTPIIANTQPLSCVQKPSSPNYSLPLDFVNMDLESGLYANHTSEDCLYLNVWTKYPALGAPLKPVLVWIYGGGFHGGGANDLTEQGGVFAEQQDVVIVNFNCMNPVTARDMTRTDH